MMWPRRNEGLQNARRYGVVKFVVHPVKKSIIDLPSKLPQGNLQIQSKMPNLISRFIIWCRAKPVSPEIKEALLTITPDEHHNLMIKLLDQPWDVTDEELKTIKKVTAERGANVIQPIIDKAKSLVRAHPLLFT